MTLHFRLRLACVYAWGFISGGVPIYYRDSKETYIRLARVKYDPWNETQTLTTNHHGCKRRLNQDGTADEFGTTKWMYVNKSRRTMQKLQNL